ncbi:MAG: tRNA pseudouridine(38-40) synthase TruA [Bacteroidota bacterium]
MRNLKFVIEYDGTDFVGWQSQLNGRSVQDEISNKLRQLLQHDINLVGAGRTDSGVHARGQVAHCHSDTAMTTTRLVRALNGLLPFDVRILSVADADEGFNARHSAIERCYRYSITTSPIAIGRQYQWFVPYKLATDAMNIVASHVVGEHDFASFCKSSADVEHHRCVVRHSAWSVSGSQYVYEVRANRFLHGMVRALVGTMVDVGRGFIEKSDFEAILSSRDRSKAGMAAPPHGLVLEEVLY